MRARALLFAAILPLAGCGGHLTGLMDLPKPDPIPALTTAGAPALVVWTGAPFADGVVSFDYTATNRASLKGTVGVRFLDRAGATVATSSLAVDVASGSAYSTTVRDPGYPGDGAVGATASIVGNAP